MTTFPKIGKRIRTKRDADRALDRSESQKVRERSGGRCEVRWLDRTGQELHLCTLRAVHVHHMIGGRGKRGVGRSALKEHKQAVCEGCHLDITGGVGGKKLIRIGGPVPLWTDVYEARK